MYKVTLSTNGTIFVKGPGIKLSFYTMPAANDFAGFMNKAWDQGYYHAMTKCRDDLIVATRAVRHSMARVKAKRDKA